MYVHVNKCGWVGRLREVPVVTGRLTDSILRPSTKQRQSRKYNLEIKSRRKNYKDFRWEER